MSTAAARKRKREGDAKVSEMEKDAKKVFKAAPGDNLSFDLGETFQGKFAEGITLSEATVTVMNRFAEERKAVTFDEVTLEDKPSNYHPNDVKLETFISRRISLKGAGIISAAMDTVTEAELALALAKMGGIGILHRNLSVEEQSAMVNWVRRKIHFGGMIDKPIVFHENMHFSDMQATIAAHGYTFTSFPIVNDKDCLVGLVTRDEMEFAEHHNPILKDIMKLRCSIVTAPEGTTRIDAYTIMKAKHVKKLPVVTTDGRVKGMYVWSDVRSDEQKRENFSLDHKGNFLVGAAIGVGEDDMRRVKELASAGCPLLVIDSSHGACKPALDQVRRIKLAFQDQFDVVVGNIASYESAMYLLRGEYKPDALKVGIGPGSICTTRQVTGHGIPQLTAVYQVWRAVQDYGKETGYYVPIIADGGIRTSGDIVKCFAAGASAVMMGGIFAGTKESPGQVIQKGGKTFKTVRGMGSRSAMEERSGSRHRYHRESKKTGVTETLTTHQKQKVVPEGVEGLVLLKGTVESVMTELLGGIQAGLSHTGCNNIKEFRNNATFWVQSTAGVSEGRPHDLTDIR
eukprot:CAMPEP_0119119646 /NCGR_PEP_ID=MMETSP1310-20130426/1042_1 /TAXON_ID=464262 /ORGANISM="Genus nov. species nov., Strain RCC2339" /LENGTH=570 /DNA_ID=CAMNT_0007109091 /DNA_START=84 /DNA_END=1792 /DNA_ORIENTATION=-